VLLDSIGYLESRLNVTTKNMDKVTSTMEKFLKSLAYVNSVIIEVCHKSEKFNVFFDSTGTKSKDVKMPQDVGRNCSQESFLTTSIEEPPNTELVQMKSATSSAVGTSIGSMAHHTSEAGLGRGDINNNSNNNNNGSSSSSSSSGRMVLVEDEMDQAWREALRLQQLEAARLARQRATAREAAKPVEFSLDQIKSSLHASKDLLAHPDNFQPSEGATAAAGAGGGGTGGVSADGGDGGAAVPTSNVATATTVVRELKPVPLAASMSYFREQYVLPVHVYKPMPMSSVAQAQDSGASDNSATSAAAVCSLDPVHFPASSLIKSRPHPETNFHWIRTKQQQELVRVQFEMELNCAHGSTITAEASQQQQQQRVVEADGVLESACSQLWLSGKCACTSTPLVAGAAAVGVAGVAAAVGSTAEIQLWIPVAFRIGNTSQDWCTSGE
jgi:hypothetical protein